MRKTVTLTAGAPTTLPGHHQTQASPSTTKENLYIVALPQGHQLRQGQNLVAATIFNTSASAVSTTLARSITTAPSSPATTPSASAPSTPPTISSQTDRRNVAEILASLSGLMPEPPQNLEKGSQSQQPPKGVQPPKSVQPPKCVQPPKGVQPQPPKINSGVTITPITTATPATTSVNTPTTTVLETKPKMTATILSSGSSTGASGSQVTSSTPRVLRVFQSSKAGGTTVAMSKTGPTLVVTPSSSSG